MLCESPGLICACVTVIRLQKMCKHDGILSVKIGRRTVKLKILMKLKFATTTELESTFGSSNNYLCSDRAVSYENRCSTGRLIAVLIIRGR